MRLRKPSREIMIIGGSTLLVLAGAFYGYASISAWKGYASRLTAEQARFSELRQTALNGDSTDARLSAIRELDDKVATRDDLCSMNPLFSWQSAIVPPIRNGVDQCKAAVKRLDSLAVPLNKLRGYLDVGVSVQSSVEKLATSTELTEANWKELGLDRAKTVQSELKAIATKGKVAGELKDQASNAAGKLVSSWEALIKANQEKDASGFVKASEDVTSAYASFVALADTSDSQIKQLVSKLQAHSKR